MLKATKTDLFPFCRLTMHVMCSKSRQDFKDLLVAGSTSLGKLVEGKAGVELSGLSSRYWAQVEGHFVVSE